MKAKLKVPNKREKKEKKLIHSRHDNKTYKIVANLEKAYTY